MNIDAEPCLQELQPRREPTDPAADDCDFHGNSPVPRASGSLTGVQVWTVRASSDVVLANIAQNLVQRAEKVPALVFLDAVKHLQQPAMEHWPELLEGRSSLRGDSDVTDPHVVGARLAADVALLRQRRQRSAHGRPF